MIFMKGISQLVSFALTMLFVVISATITLSVILPTFERMQDSSLVNEARQNLELINSVIKEVAAESQGSKRTVTLRVTDGEYRVNTTSETLYWEHELRSDFVLEGYIGDVQINKTGPKKIRLSITYTKIDFNTTVRIPKGTQQVVIENIGKNDAGNKVVVAVTKS
jgi:type II secretory pathway pseudopilin PulG